MNKKIIPLHSKQDYQNVFLDLLQPLKKYYTEDGALLHLGATSAHYCDHTADMEGFSRPLWGLASFLGGGGSALDFKELYLSGLASGCDPSSKNYWGDSKNYDQLLVEMAAIAYSMLLSPEHLWDPLKEDQKEQLANWLWQINEYECVQNNWQFFCILVNTALYKRQMPYSRERLDICLDRIDSYYTGDGWYKDGTGGQNDYYIGFAMHFYGLIYAVFMDKEDPQRCARFRERAAEFAQDFIYWFDDTGAAIPYGRSLTYRFAQASFFSACIWAGVETFPLPVLKGILSRHMQDWLNSSMLDHEGLLTIGYKYPNLHMSEDYNAPGSPYWSMKYFLILALPDEHPFWTVKAAPLPEFKPIRYIEKTNMIIQHSGNHSVMLAPGLWRHHSHHHLEAKYSKFAYSTRLGFSVPISCKSLHEAAPDSSLAFEIGGHFFVRDYCDKVWMEEGSLFSKWSPFPGITVISSVTPIASGHVREHKIKSDYPCKAYECGFSIAADPTYLPEESFDTGYARVRNANALCEVKTIQGKGEGMVIHAAPNSNLIFSKTWIPCIRYEVASGELHITNQIEVKLDK